MEFIKNLYKGSTGSDVLYIKQKLFDLKYYSPAITAITNSTFGSDTYAAVLKFQKENTDLTGKPLAQDGVIGILTWSAILEQCEVPYRRTLMRTMSGEDVYYIKTKLFKQKYFSPQITTIRSTTYGTDTYHAVQAYQEAHKMPISGIIDFQTWTSILEGEDEEDEDIEFAHIAKAKMNAINRDLEKVSSLRQKIVREILNYAYDPDVPGDVRGLYIFGANLYDTKRQINYADEAEIEKHAKRYPDYFNGGRKEWMLEQVRRNPKLPASDCSGLEVGYMREHGLVAATYDASANGLCGSSNSSAIAKSQLQPGDWVGKSGHIGTYVGGGYVVEYYGGSYGCQLTALDNRQGYDFLQKKMRKGSPWTAYRRPKYY